MSALFLYMENTFYVYALVSRINSRIYVGMSQEVPRRLMEHNAGRVRSTKGDNLWALFYKEVAGDSGQARVREKYFKSASGKRRLKAILGSTEVS